MQGIIKLNVEEKIYDESVLIKVNDNSNHDKSSSTQLKQKKKLTDICLKRLDKSSFKVAEDEEGE